MRALMSCAGPKETTWFLAIYHLAQSKGGTSSIDLGRRLGVHQATAWLNARARGIGEQLVKQAFPAATILRPGVIFAPQGGLLNRLAALARVLPVLPLFGAGETKLQCR
ncbi:MAG: hypothetical protein OET79_11695 [Nitrospirota bacterium]|nr:hypothetical protein [Nitrospirota bacterium]